jgi:hypothetical protein
MLSHLTCLDDAEPHHVTNTNAPVERERVLRFLGHPPGARLDPRFADALNIWILAASRQATPQAVYVITRVAARGGHDLRLQRGRTTRLFQGISAAPLTGASWVAAFLATAGPGVEALSRELLARKQMTAGMIVDAVGAERADAAANRVLQTLRQRVAPLGLSVSIPVLPGQCGFDLEQQTSLFDLFDGHTAGITLTPDFLMRPLKSMSGLVAIGPRDQIISEGSPCDQCDRAECAIRERNAS